ncbi:ATP-binding protein [Fervidicoccus fontis]|uniref:ATP-binding protein n=2 Tax=Fervidicoccus fontis TaxID=683846 RepID=A0A7C2VAS4_9CREN|nr:ATP-binding protein [Fervidicoccus fontis]AFH42785.1 putative ATPase [Fervidicoccus fontis Kam940]MBE9391347.1 ATP-binding protein [Fervidicoccus fontis]PMB76389.1 MAG: cysteine/glutathione ABC transporter ATP-binding protein/permease CydC [Fervidicoccus fontis]HEW64124.1 ATP-binding protein [Fervidicoccus fontis]
MSKEEIEIDIESQEILGYVIGESTPFRITFLSNSPPRVGEYVFIKHDEDYLLGMVDRSYAGNPYVPEDITNINVFKNYMEAISVREYSRGSVKIITKLKPLLERGISEAPKTPPKSSYPVYRASDKILTKIFSPNVDNCYDDYCYDPYRKIGYVRIGVLSNHPNVPVFVKVDPIVSRHLAILAVTGAGKSNSVSILTERITCGLNGTVLIFDIHGEYASSDICKDKQNIVPPKINPFSLSIFELFRLARIRDDAIKQQSILRRVYKYIKDNYKPSDPNTIEYKREFLNKILEVLKSELEKKLKKKNNTTADKGILGGFKDDEILNVINKLEDLESNYSAVLTPDAPEEVKIAIKPNELNIVDLSGVDENGSDVIVSYYTRRLLEERKKYVTTRREGYPSPILIIVEEAHILVPKDEETLTKDIIGKIAREGRKFGVGICLVSQRPKNIDENSLSQTNNRIILKIIEPNDLQYIQRATEQMSSELLELLPGLRTGEAVLLGEFTKIPALVKIDEHSGKKIGKDLEISSQWISSGKDKREEFERIKDELEMIKG